MNDEINDWRAASVAVRREIAKTASERDRSGALPLEAVALVRAARLQATLIPQRYGGLGLGFEVLAEVVLNLAAGDASLAQSLQPHFIFLERVRLMGTEAQRSRYLGACADGALFGNAMSEIGGPAGAWSVRLTRHGDGLRLNGRKFYATGTSIAEHTFVGALDDEGHRVLVIVPVTRRGVGIQGDWQAIGQRATASGTVLLDDVEVGSDEVISLARWDARRHHTGAASQLIHSAIDAGIAAAALDEAVAFARDHARASRDSGLVRAVDDPEVQRVVGDVAVQAFAARAAVLEAGRRVDAAANMQYASMDDEVNETLEALLVDASIATAQAKVITTRACLHAAEALFEVGGASAAAAKHNLDRHWRNARTHTLHDPLAHKYLVVGRQLLTGTPPPNTFTY